MWNMWLLACNSDKRGRSSLKRAQFVKFVQTYLTALQSIVQDFPEEKAKYKAQMPKTNLV